MSGHERRDLNLRAVGLFAAGLVLLGVVAHALVARLFSALESREERRRSPQRPGATAAEPPSPRLEEISGQALEKIRLRDAEELETYGWVDRSRGQVRLPITRAMELLLQRGLPVRRAGGVMR